MRWWKKSRDPGISSYWYLLKFRWCKYWAKWPSYAMSNSVKITTKMKCRRAMMGNPWKWVDFYQLLQLLLSFVKEHCFAADLKFLLHALIWPRLELCINCKKTFHSTVSLFALLSLFTRTEFLGLTVMSNLGFEKRRWNEQRLIVLNQRIHM